MPVNVSTISDDLNNAVEGVWYYYDPHTVVDVSGHASNWIAVGPNGIEFYVDEGNRSYMRAEYNHAYSCRVATPLLKPDGTGQFTADDLQGIDFRAEPGENMPHADNIKIGVAVGIAKAEICSTDSGNSRDERKFGLGVCYGSDATTGDAKIGYNMFTGGNGSATDDGGSAFKAATASFEFERKDDDEVGCGYASGVVFDSDDEYGNIRKSMLNTYYLGTTDKIFLWVQPWSYNSGTDDANIIRTGAFKLWYRLRYSATGRTPDWIEGRVNNHSGVNTDRY
jgi:hypothetical protein